MYFARGAAAADDDGDVGVGHVHAFVEYPARDQLGVGAAPEGGQRGLALLGGCAVGDRRQQQALADARPPAH